MKTVLHVSMKERYPTGIGRKCTEFAERMSRYVPIRRHQIHHVEFMFRGRPRLGYLSVLANRMIPIRRRNNELLHAGDFSLIPFFSDPFQIVEIADLMPFDRFDVYQRDLVSAMTASSYIPETLKAGCIVVHSAETRRKVRALFGKDSVVIPIGIDTAFFDIDPTIEKDPLSVFAVAAYYPQKNLLNLVRGCGEASLESPLVLRLAGRRDGGSIEREAEAIAKSYPDLRYESLGYITQARLREEYNRAAIVASASTMEGFGMTPIEAMACGTFPVLSDIPTHRETADGHGFFFDPKDPEDIGKRINEGLAAASSIWADHRDELRRAANSYAWPSVIRRWLDLYASFGLEPGGGWGYQPLV